MVGHSWTGVESMLSSGDVTGCFNKISALNVFASNCGYHNSYRDIQPWANVVVPRSTQPNILCGI